MIRNVCEELVIELTNNFENFAIKKKSLASVAAFCKHHRDSGQQRIGMLRAKREINDGVRG